MWSVGLACLNDVMSAAEHAKHQLQGFDKGKTHNTIFCLALFLYLTDVQTGLPS